MDPDLDQRSMQTIVVDDRKETKAHLSVSVAKL